MCGISGAVGAVTLHDTGRCERMSERLRHRGPDDAGTWTWQLDCSFGAILCHRRLSIIDLRSIAAEPMISEETGTAIVFNGEIYNFQELRAELEAAGHRFITNGDTEVILKGFDQWGPRVLSRLRGMFALVIVDARNRRVVMGRDGYGIKPLYWTQFEGAAGRPALAFASEARALIDAGFAARSTDPARIGRYLWNGFMPGPQTIWTEVQEVPRGSFAVLDEAHVIPKFEKLWDVGSSLRRAIPIDLEEADDLIAETVKLHLIADVPTVVFLSGGVDSTAVAAAAAPQVGELHTLSVAFDDAVADERRFAGAAAAAIGTTHHVVELSASGVLDDLEDAVSALDQPSFDGVNTWFVSREAARLGFKVALSGAGGDELVGGYTSFRRALRAGSVMHYPGSNTIAGLSGRVLERLFPDSKVGQLGRAFGALERMYQTQYALFSVGTLQRLLRNSNAFSTWGLEPQRLADLENEIVSLSVLRGVTALESEMFLGDRLLRDMDSVGMAHSIELRVPLVDTFLSDKLAGLSDADRYAPVGEKQLLRRQSRMVLPESFFARPKRGFEFPMDSWMRGPLRPFIEATLLDPEKCSALDLEAGEVTRIWRRFLEREGAVYWTRPWALFSLLHWASVNSVTCH